MAGKQPVVRVGLVIAATAGSMACARIPFSFAGGETSGEALSGIFRHE